MRKPAPVPMPTFVDGSASTLPRPVPPTPPFPTPDPTPPLPAPLPPPLPTGGYASPLVKALEAAWDAIRRHHSDVPAAVLILGSGTVGAPAGSVKLGHFAATRWQHGENKLPEVFVSGEGLSGTAEDVLGTLLHEAVHALAHTRGIKDTSRQGRYHNTRYADLARELGLRVETTGSIGWSVTRLTETTRKRYVDVVSDLAPALTIWRHNEQATEKAPAASTRNPPCLCGCGRRIRVAPSVLAEGPITCSLCGGPFTVEESK